MSDNPFDDLLAKIEQVNPDASAKESITQAGAEAFADELKKVGKQKHYGHGEEHMVDAIVTKRGDIDGTRLGDSTVGFSRRFASYLAMWTNYGTIKQRGDGWIDKARESEDVRSKVAKAEEEAMEKWIQSQN